ncbi:ArsR/SmtB family transcription factor [Streptomyces sp. NPDC097727]|uniref:ArsR/SmtB family transcription factor n=1 Tax=Streptomyces sp. NPDC097727 TaxID=3366092 RepID=UPI0037F88FE6
MSKQELVVLGQDAAEGCCPTLLTAPLDEDRAVELAKVFKALGDPVRIRLLSMIASREGGEICVCDLTPAFDLSQPTISHHLKLLREAGLIASERRGTWVYYRLLPAMTDRLAAVLTRPGNPDVPPLQPLDGAGAAS